MMQEPLLRPPTRATVSLYWWNWNYMTTVLLLLCVGQCWTPGCSWRMHSPWLTRPWSRSRGVVMNAGLSSMSSVASPVLLVLPTSSSSASNSATMWQKKAYLTSLLTQLHFSHTDLPVSSESTDLDVGKVYVVEGKAAELSKLLSQHDNKAQSVYLWIEDGDLILPNEHQDSEEQWDEELRAQCKHVLYLNSRQYQVQGEDRNRYPLQRLLESLLGSYRRPSIYLEAGPQSHFLSLTYPDLTVTKTFLHSELRQGIDAFELRVDLLAPSLQNNMKLFIKYIHQQIAFLRTHCPGVPIVYTVRTKDQLGSFPNEKISEIETLLLEGVKAGVEFLDIEVTLPTDTLDRLLQEVEHRNHAEEDKEDSHNNNHPNAKTRIVASYHTRDILSSEQIKEMMIACNMEGRSDIIKLVTGAGSDQDCFNLHAAMSQYIVDDRFLYEDVDSSSSSNTAIVKRNKLYIGLCIGEKGQLSRVMNCHFTPVTHDRIARPQLYESAHDQTTSSSSSSSNVQMAAPGQLTVKQLVEERIKRGILRFSQHYLTGSPIGYSLSPAMHNTAFSTLLIPNVYTIFEEHPNQSDDTISESFLALLEKKQGDVTPSQGVPNSHNIIQRVHEDYTRRVDASSDLMERIAQLNKAYNRTVFFPSSCGGISVTIPYKEFVLNEHICDEVIGAARDIEAVNTLVIKSSKGLEDRLCVQGYNTDWLGMYRPIQKLLKLRECSAGVATNGIGLVIGAGGTAKAACYVIRQLGLKLVVANRDKNKAQDLAARFGGTALSLDELHHMSAADLVDVDGDGKLQVVISTLPGHVVDFQLPKQLLIAEDNLPPIVLDVVYKPALTPLLQQALANHCPVVQGATMLLEQGIEQFQLWNHRLAPRFEMQQIIFQNVDKIDSV